MNKISTSDIKKLRDLTGAGFLDCKEALDNSGADLDKAIDFLRKKGISTAQKKGDRISNEGLVAISKDKLNKEAVIIEINSETDFVSKNKNFQEFVFNLSQLNLKQKGNLDQLIKSKYNEDGENVSDVLTNLISKIGENITIRRSGYMKTNEGCIGTYMHNVEKQDMGKIGVLVSVITDIEFSIIKDFLKNICMHIAATNPISISSSQIDSDTLKKEKEFQLEEIKKSGKNQSIQEKILEGKMNKYFKEVVLLEQNFVMDDSIKISQYILNTEKDLNGRIEIKEFTRFKVGEVI